MVICFFTVSLVKFGNEGSLKLLMATFLYLNFVVLISIYRIGKKRKQPEIETSKLIPTVDSSSDDQIVNEQNGIFLCLFKLVNKLYVFNSHLFIRCSFVRYAYEEDLPTSSWVYMGCLYTMWNAQTC